MCVQAVQEFEVAFMICTSVAVDTSTTNLVSCTGVACVGVSLCDDENNSERTTVNYWRK